MSHLSSSLSHKGLGVKKEKEKRENFRKDFLAGSVAGEFHLSFAWTRI